MGTVEIVIKIPEEWIEQFKAFEHPSALQVCVLQGTVFPKGHGRLLILDEKLVKKYFTSFSFSCQKWISEVGISNAILKIIKADKEVENESD